MSTVLQSRGNGYSGAAAAEALLHVRRQESVLANTKVILGLHGRGAEAAQFSVYSQPAIFGPGYHVYNLVDSGGYQFVALDHGGGTPWGNATAMARIDDMVAYLTGAGVPTSKIGLMGWSMGGIVALNWIKRNPTKVAAAWLWAPATDLDFFHATAGYTPSYALSGVTAGAYLAEIDTAYGGSGSYAANSAGYRVRDEYASWRGINVPIRIAHAADDATIPVGQTDAFVAGVNDALVTKRSVTTGGHVGLFGQVPGSEVVSHFQTYL